MTESLSSKYIGLLVWVLGICGTRLLPERIENPATTVVMIGFVVWFGWVSQSTGREVKRQLAALAALRRAHHSDSAGPSPRLATLRRDA